MAYEDKLQDKVSEHPMEEFAAMGDLSEMDNFGDQLAELLNALSTNIIIPTNDKQELKGFVANHAHEEVYGTVDGGLKIAKPPSDTSASEMSPSDISVNDVSGESVPDRQTIDANREIQGIADYDKTATFYVQTTPSVNNGIAEVQNPNDTSYWYKTPVGNRGHGLQLEFTVDCSSFNELHVEILTGSKPNKQTQTLSSGANIEYRAGESGDGVKLVDGNGNTVVQVAGGAGSAAAVAEMYEYETGLSSYNRVNTWESQKGPAGGGGTRETTMSLDTSNYNYKVVPDGANHGYVVDTHDSVSISTDTKTRSTTIQSARVDAFI